MSFTSCGQRGKVSTLSNAMILTYSIELEIMNDSMPEYTRDYLNQKYVDSVQITYDSRGNIRMDYFGSGKSGMDYNIYNAKKHLMYAKWKNRECSLISVQGK